MKTTIRPSRATGAVPAPPGKSMAHRLLICAGLAEGTSRIHGIAESEDVLATLDCLRALGASASLEGGTAVVTGADVRNMPERAVLPCRDCGSALRFFAPIALLDGKERSLTGSEVLLSRPLGVYQSLAEEKGFTFSRERKRILVRGPLVPGLYSIPGDVSSQFVSGLLFALPQLAGDSILSIRPPVASRPYIDMTVEAMRMFGAEVKWRDGRTADIPGGQRFRGRDADVGGDWSNAAFFLAMGLKVTGLSEDSLQGDRCCARLFRELAAGFAEIDLTDCPDLGPVLFVFAAMHHGARFTGTRRLRGKESDRVASMACELRKCGVVLAEEENAVTVPGGVSSPGETLDGHGDHRVVMALSVLCAETGGTIRGAEAVSKSFPDFFRRLEEAGIRMEHSDEE